MPAHDLKMTYFWDDELALFRQHRLEAFSYSDGVEVEERLLRIIGDVTDRSTFSVDLAEAVSDWPSEYHLSRNRHCLIRPLGIRPGEKVLELGCGCGAVTRYLGEIGAEVTAVEGSLARARIAAARCRDLPNVKVFVDSLLQFESAKSFTWVLLIGVLEYAPVFSNAKDPVLDYLRSVTRFLSPQGRLVIGIENKLGLKYLNGCGEDHLGTPFLGLQDLYGEKTPRTYGRRELQALLTTVDLERQTFLYPFPDYKLPTAVVSEAGFEDPQFHPVDLMLRSPARDYTGYPYRLFDETLVSATLQANSLLGEFSNSFLVVAAPLKAEPFTPDFLAVTFAVNRVPEFSTVTHFKRTGASIQVTKQPIFPDLHRSRNFPTGCQLTNDLTDSPYHSGQQLLWKMLRVRANRGTLDQIVSELRPWLLLLLQFAEARTSSEPFLIGAVRQRAAREWLVPGKYLDCTPFNLICSGDELLFIDQEWIAQGLIPLGLVLARGVFYSLSTGLTDAHSIQSTTKVVQNLCSSVGLKADEADIRSWLDMEKDFQSLVTGRDFSRLVFPLDQTHSGLIGIHQAFADSQRLNADLNGELADRDRRIAGLDQELARETVRLSSLEQSLSDRDREIESLGRETADLRRQMEGLYNSLSWRVTYPLRRLFKIRRTRFVILLEVVARVIKTRSRRPLRQFHQYLFLRRNTAFDRDYYLKTSSDVAGRGLDPLWHYIVHGSAERRNPNGEFNTFFYLQNNPDVAGSALNPFYHFIKHGAREGRFPSEARMLEATSAQLERFCHRLFEPEDRVLHQWPRVFEELQKSYQGNAPALYALSQDLLGPFDTTPPGPYTRPPFPEAVQDRCLEILYVSGMFPSVEHGGGLRLFDILSSLTGRHRVDLYSTFIEELDRHSYELLAERFRHLRLTHKPLPELADLTTWLKALRADGDSYDIIQLEYPTTIGLADGLRLFGRKIGFTFMESISKSAAINVMNKLLTPEIGPALNYFLHCARLEKEIALKADILIALSEEDAAFIQRLSGVAPHIVPTGVSDYFFNERLRRQPETIQYDAAYVGYFDHTPNIDAMVYYYEHIHPKVRIVLPAYRLVVIGRGNTEPLRSLTAGDDSISYTGHVDAVAVHIARARIGINPIVSGAGLRGKINQYSFLGRPTVSTTLGLFGTPYVHETSVLKSDDPEDFARAIIRLLTDEGLYGRISRACREVALQHFGWTEHIRKLEALYYR
jgi:glycosyltransferase involved in cell wall biosynthesis/SAM-dependent methyltransferase